jgi:hypothetical protein
MFGKMKTFEEYSNDLISSIVKHWKKDNDNIFENIEKDPVINLFLSAFAYQSFHINNAIERYEENMIKEFRDKLIPHHLIKATPAFSIMQTKIKNLSDEDAWEKIIDESYKFEFSKNKTRFSFSPLFKTKIINAEIGEEYRVGNVVGLELKSKEIIKDLSGMSFYIESETLSDVDILCEGTPVPLIKPSKYNELPFTGWFNNNHLLLSNNYHLFGSYDYWQEIFLTNQAQLFYVDEYDARKINFGSNKNIRLEIVFKETVDLDRCKVKINCIPVVNVEKKEITLNNSKPIQELTAENEEFLNLLMDEDVKDIEDYTKSFLIRRYGVERYNSNQLLLRLKDIFDQYISDCYAFQSISGLKNSDKLEKLQKIVEEIHGIVTKNNNAGKSGFYALLKLNEDLSVRKENIHIEFLCTSGESANGIKKDEKATKSIPGLDKDHTILLQETKGGKGEIKSENQKEEIAKYYSLTGDKLVTITDIKSFCYKELEGQIRKIHIKKEQNNLVVEIELNEKIDKMIVSEAVLQKKIELRSIITIPVTVHFV